MTPRHEPSEARTPAYGLRLSIDDDNVVVSALDGSGRGRPCKALVVPVERQGERFHMIGPDASPFWRAYKPKWPEPAASEEARGPGRRISSQKPAVENEMVTLYSFTVPRAEWPESAHVLVFLVYDQSQGIGGRPRAPRLNKRSDMVSLVRDALDSDSVGELRGGLIRCRETEGRPPTPSPGTDRPVTFAVASCQYPADMFNRMPNGEHATRGPADRSLLALADRLDGPNPPTLLLLCGDQVYTDATAGLFDPKVSDQRFRIPHEQRGESRGSMAVMQRSDLRVEMMLDDHEIRDNWAPNDEPPPPPGGQSTVEIGKLAYFRYERGLLNAPTHVWYSIEHEGLPFFLGDTRTERKGKTALNWRTKRIMSSCQLEALCKWLVDPRYKDLPKFVLTPSAMLPRRVGVAEQPARALHSDAWDGYPASMYDLLGFLCENEVKGVVFLSGDEHVSSVVTATVTNADGSRSCRLHSVHSSPLFAPYAFANGRMEDFVANESFCLRDPGTSQRFYRCEVKADFFPGDGFAVLTADSDPTGWHLGVDFYDDAGERRLTPRRLALGLP